MNLVLAVIDDLFGFAFNSVRGLFHIAVPPRSAPFELPAAPSDTPTSEEVMTTFRSAAEILATAEVTTDASRRPEKNTVMYVGSDGAPMFLNPTVEFDAVKTRIPYGSMVMVLEQKGRWSRISVGETTGWILRDDLIDRAAFVYPHFVIGEHNEAEDPNTIRLRAIIEDTFNAGVAQLPLQSSEYVYYRLLRKGITLTWPEIRPRREGQWHTLLKGTPGVHVGIVPKTGSVMEYTEEDGTGHLAYVEAVFPDETINISEANFPEAGIYNERVITREEWRELKPVFIQVG